MLSYQSYWIQHMKMAIYDNLGRAKGYLTHPIWSIVNRKYNPRQIYFFATILCELKNLCENTMNSVNQLKTIISM